MQIDWRIKEFSELTTPELYDIMHIRQVVFVVEQNAAYVDADYKDQKAWHIMAYDKNTLAAYARVIAPGISYEEPCIGRVVNLPPYRRTGLGRTLMQKAIEVLEGKYKTTQCRISAQSYLIPFYTDYGFEVCSEEYLEDGLPHKEMKRI
jgi:ElaA protein